ncbi:MAG TPA: HAD family hydrolase [Candidatus Saccharimonadales bacterium]|nr:HAD family hydrolase [Candidatus Saccharimonadales bacterium]
MPRHFEGESFNSEGGELWVPDEQSDTSDADQNQEQPDVAEEQEALARRIADLSLPASVVLDDEREGDAEPDTEESEAAVGEGAMLERQVERLETEEVAPIKIIYFDRDDLLIDSGQALHNRHLTLWEEQHEGEEVPEEFSEKVWESVGGKGEDIMATLWPEETEEERAELLERFRQLSREDESPAQPIEGVVEGVQRLRDAGIRIGLITNGSVKIEQSLREVGLEPEQFEHIFAQGEGHISFEDKASALQQAQEMTGVPLENIMVVGDAIGDVQAGDQTGAQSVGIPRYGADAEQLLAAGADRVFASFGEFVDWVLNLPQFRPAEPEET